MVYLIKWLSRASKRREKGFETNKHISDNWDMNQLIIPSCKLRHIFRLRLHRRKMVFVEKYFQRSYFPWKCFLLKKFYDVYRAYGKLQNLYIYSQNLSETRLGPTRDLFGTHPGLVQDPPGTSLELVRDLSKTRPRLA